MKKLLCLICGYVMFFLPSMFAGETIEQKVDSIAELIDKYYFSRGTLAEELVDELFCMAEANPERIDILVEAIYWEALVEYSQRTSEPAPISKIDSLLQQVTIKENLYETARLTYSRALANMAHGNYPEAFQDAINALELFNQTDDKRMITKTLITLGNICPYIQNYDLGESYYDRAEKMVSKHDADYYRIKVNRSRIPYFKGRQKEAVQALAEIIPEIIQVGDTALLIATHINLGSYYTAVEEREKAFENYIKAMELMEHIDNNNLLLLLNHNIGNYYRYHVRDYDTAYHYYLKTKELAIRDKNLERLSSVVYELSGLFLDMEQPDSAYHYLTEYNDMIHRLMNPKTANMYKSYTTMVMESSANKLKIAEQEVLLKNKQMIVVFVTALAIIIVFILLLVITMQKRKNIRQQAQLQEIENKKLSEQLLQEQKIQELQSEKIEDKLREVTSYSLLVAQKNDLLSQVLDLTKQMKNEPDDLAEAKVKIEKLVKSNLHTDDYWNDFVLHFNQVNPRFFEQLQSAFPELTPNDLKLCAYIRIGMTAKQIAQMLNLSPDSVNKNRYRLRKKLGLEKEVNLDDFIRFF